MRIFANVAPFVRHMNAEVPFSVNQSMQCILCTAVRVEEVGLLGNSALMHFSQLMGCRTFYVSNNSMPLRSSSTVSPFNIYVAATLK